MKVNETTTPKNSYTVKETSSTTKLDLSLKETPQSITVITQKQIEDQNLQDINDVLEQTPGITTVQFGQNGAGYTTYYSRGFAINNFQRDGIPTTTSSFDSGDLVGIEDTSMYERIEVVRGSTGLTNGSGNPAASINYVRKKPTKDFQGNAKVSYGSWDTYKGNIDLSSGLNSSGSIRGRLVASYGDGGNQQDRYNKNNSTIYGALDFDLTDNTLLTTAISYQKTDIDNATAHGFPFITTDNPKQKQITFGRNDNPSADYAYSNTEKTNLLLGLEHYFNDDWRAVANYSYTKSKNDRVYATAGSNGVLPNGFSYNSGLMTVSTGKFESTPDVHSLDLYGTGNFNVFNREHKISFGVNGYSMESDDPTYNWVTNAVNINGWNGHVPNATPLAKNGKRVLEEKQIGLFAALNLELSKPLHLILGGRVTNWERVNNKATTREKTQKEDAVITPYLGLVYDINENFSTYASYTSIFNPTNRENASGDYLDPEEGNTVEFGLKSEFYDGKLNTSIAYFITKQDNLAVIDTSYPNGYLNSNGVTPHKSVNGAKIKGWDLTIGGEILPNWDISGGYTYTEAKDRNGNFLNTATLPKQTFKVFTSYKYNNFTIGAGANYQSEIYNSSATGLASNLQRQKAYSVVNAMAKYDIKKDFSVILNANNLFDEKYTLNVTNNAWGDERNYTLSLNYKF
ncbi:TonB-dependent siderophore receptor [Arcobacter sp. FW59]|nr:TonB-dependent siderophore receptor [Arcobacter sp. FW59]